MSLPSFAVTFDYRCPFARNVHEHVVAGLRSGVDWDVELVPFSLSRTKVEPGAPDVWDDPASDSGLLALQVGVAVRDGQPERFGDAHLALFALRHDYGGDLRDPDALRAALDRADADADAAFAEVASGTPLKKVQEEHTQAVADHAVWGVPTFITGTSAAFVRLMDRPGPDDAAAVRTIERIVGLLDGWPELNELKHTTISR